MLFDFDHVPFSRHLRFTTLSMRPCRTTGDKQCYLRFVAGGDERPSLGDLCRISFTDLNGTPLHPRYELTPASLNVALFSDQEKAATASFAIGEGEVLHLKAENAQICFSLEGSRYDYAYKSANGRDCVVAAGENLRLSPFVHQGDCLVRGEWRRDHAEDVQIVFSGAKIDAGIQLHERLAPTPPTNSFVQTVQGADNAFVDWCQQTNLSTAEKLAHYLLWANTVPASGQLGAPAIYMSKNHMTNIWSWDNAFSAIGVAAHHPQLAFDQFAVIYDHQDASGLLPDFVHDKGKSYSFTKPPVHGWALQHILSAEGQIFTAEQNRYLREKLEFQFDYWLSHTRNGPDRLPSYAHGNDSGWDNASFFAHGGPVEGPDLPTFLALTARMISNLYHNENNDSGVKKYAAREDELIAQMVAQLWDGTTFQVRHRVHPELALPDQSLIQYMPLLLGEKLPSEISQKLIAQFNASGMLTDWGPATEAPSSELYESDGYWRGPIWAPTTMLVFDGLLAQGEMATAKAIAERFTKLCETSGMAENFDALTGAGLRDRAFAWTSAVYLRFRTILANDFGEEI